MGVVYRTDGPWGPGLSADLTPAQVDGNFWQLVQDVTAKAVQGVGISNFVVAGGDMTVVLTDHTLLGPYPLPLAKLNFRGEWLPNTAYLANDIITENGSTYMVLVNHTSEATFDPGANDGAGQDYYGLLLTNPATTLPAGGSAGWFLRKVTGADYVTHWMPAALEDLSDIAVSSPVEGEVLTWSSGAWENLPLPAESLSGLSDVHIGATADGQLLTYVASSGLWANKALSLALAQLTDVAVSLPQAGQPLVFNGTKWADASTVDMPCGGIVTVSSGTLYINRAQGEVQRFLLATTVTSVNITGWPAGGHFARLVLEIQDTGGGYGWAWPSNVLWPSGTVPAVTAGGKDVFILISFDGGTTIYGNVVGQAFA